MPHPVSPENLQAQAPDNETLPDAPQEGATANPKEENETGDEASGNNETETDTAKATAANVNLDNIFDDDDEFPSSAPDNNNKQESSQDAEDEE